MICVLGAAGQLGFPLTQQLVQAGQSVRLLAHSQESAERLRQEFPTTEIIVGDMRDSDTLRQVFDGCDQLFLLTPVTDGMIEMQKQIIDVAADSGIRGIAKLSGYTANEQEISLLSKDHGATDQYIAKAGVPYTLLHPCTFMQTLCLQFSEMVRTESKIVSPVGVDKTISFVDGRDVVDVAAAVLIRNEHKNETLLITGPEAVSYGRITEGIASRLGRQIDYDTTSFDQSEQDLSAVGLSPYGAEALRGLYEMYDRGDMNDLGDAVQTWAGHPPRSIDVFLDDHIALFK